MGTFSPVHWLIALALLAALGAFVYFVGSLLWAGAKSKGKGKLVAAALLLPFVILAVISLARMGGGEPEMQKPVENGPWLEYQK